jgi:hypothetical protein
MHPRKVPELRDRVVRHYEQYTSGAMAPALIESKLYWISDSQISQAAYMAGKFGDHDGLLGYEPAEYGFMVLDMKDSRTLGMSLTDPDTGIQTLLPFRAFSWQPNIEKPRYVLATVWVDTDTPGLEFHDKKQRAPLTPVLHGTFDRESDDAQIRFIYRGSSQEIEENPFTPLFTVWYRMQEPRHAVTSVSKATTAKELKTAAKREQGPEYRDVVVVDARPRSRKPVGEVPAGQATGRKMDYREEVAGHPKWVWYGEGKSQTKRVWVDSYDRGPEDAPPKEKVKGSRTTVHKLS